MGSHRQAVVAIILCVLAALPVGVAAQGFPFDIPSSPAPANGPRDGPPDPPADTPAPSNPGGAAADSPAPVPIGSIARPVEVREITDPITIGRTIDLTQEPDDLWERIHNGFAIPNLASPLVLDRQIWYASRPGLIKQIVERSKRYLHHIVEELEKRGLPTELALLPMVESAFNPMAYSRAHASGLWQFIPSRGKTYNLQQNWWYDARRDIVASTNAALDYLEFLYEMHGDWHLALASYNWGENAVARAIEKNRAKGLPTDYSSLTMPQETRYYVPKLQALKNILLNPQAFGIDLDPIPNQPYFVTVNKTQDIDIKLAAKFAEMSVEELIALNPAYNRPVISASQSQTLVLPADRVDAFLANLENHDKPLVSWHTYTLKPGEKLERVAAQHQITLARLKKVNGINARTRARPGQQILVPIKGSNAGAEPLPVLFQPPPTPPIRARPKAPRQLVHVIEKGDTLATIAQHYRVSVDDLRRWNKIGRLAAGQRLQIKISPPAQGARSGAIKAKPVKKARKLTRASVKPKPSKPGPQVVRR